MKLVQEYTFLKFKASLPCCGSCRHLAPLWEILDLYAHDFFNFNFCVVAKWRIGGQACFETQPCKLDDILVTCVCVWGGRGGQVSVRV